MQPHLPLLFQRLPADLRRRLELAEAAAIEARLDTHAQQALNLVAVLAPRMPFDEAVERYVELMDLTGDEAEDVQTRALVALSQLDPEAGLPRERERSGWGLNWRYATPLGAIRLVRRRLRRNAEEELWLTLSEARAEEAITRMHIRHALHFVDILEAHATPPHAVSLYLDRLNVPAGRAHTVYQRALARVADAELPKFSTGARPEAQAPAPPRTRPATPPARFRDRNRE